MNTVRKSGLPGAKTFKRVAQPTPLSVDREMAVAASQFKRNGAFLKSADGKAPRLYEGTLYAAASVSGAGSKFALITSETKKVVGITNMDGNSLSAGRNVVIREVRVLYSTEGTSVKTADWQNEDRLPAELQNAEIVVLQGGERIFNMPLSDMNGFKFADFRKLSDNPFVRNNEVITIELVFPTEVNVPEATATVKQYLRFEMRVTESISKV